jgi:hypothetical protein
MIDIEIENTEECFVQLWRLIRRSRRVMRLNCKHFCIRRILQLWFDGQANNEFIWQVCNMCGQCGWDKLPSPSLYPRQHREFLRAVVAARLGISYYQVNLRAIDRAYSKVFINSTPINVNKKKRQ